MQVGNEASAKLTASQSEDNPGHKSSNHSESDTNHPKEIKFDTRRIPLKKLKIEAIKK